MFSFLCIFCASRGLWCNSIFQFFHWVVTFVLLVVCNCQTFCCSGLLLVDTRWIVFHGARFLSGRIVSCCGGFECFSGWIQVLTSAAFCLFWRLSSLLEAVLPQVFGSQRVSGWCSSLWRRCAGRGGLPRAPGRPQLWVCLP